MHSAAHRMRMRKNRRSVDDIDVGVSSPNRIRKSKDREQRAMTADELTDIDKSSRKLDDDLNRDIPEPKKKSIREFKLRDIPTKGDEKLARNKNEDDSAQSLNDASREIKGKAKTKKLESYESRQYKEQITLQLAVSSRAQKKIETFKLLDSSNDNDLGFDDVDINLDGSDNDIIMRSDSYDSNSDNWQPLPNDASDAFKKLSDSFIDKKLTELDLTLKNMVDAATASSGEGVSREILNDIYFLARDMVKQSDNPLLDFVDGGQVESDIVKFSRKLIAEIDAMETKEGFIRRTSAKGYLSYKLSILPDLDRQTFVFLNSRFEDDYDADLNSASFIRSALAGDSPLGKKILDYRSKIMDEMAVVIEATDSAFKSKILKSSEEKLIRKTVNALKDALEAVELIQGRSILQVSDNAVIRDLNFAVVNMRAASQSFLMIDAKGKPKKITRIKKLFPKSKKDEFLFAPEVIEPLQKRSANQNQRVKLVNKLYQLSEELMVSDNRVINFNIDDAFSNLYDVAVKIEKINPQMAKKFKETVDKILTTIEDAIVNDSPEATPISLLVDDLQIILTGIKAPDEIINAPNNNPAKPIGKDSNLVPVPDEVATVADVGSQVSAIAGLAGDVFRSIRLIREIQSGDAIVKSKNQLYQGGAIGFNVIKNTATLAGYAAGAKLAADAFGVVGSGASAILGAGYAIHGGMIIVKTRDQLNVAVDLEDSLKIKRDLIKRINTKQRRAILEVVGGTLAVVGGVVVIVATLGAATPLVIGLAAAATIASGVIGAELATERLVGKNKKKVGKKRNALAVEAFKYMQIAVAEGNITLARDLAKALTNNKTKQYFMVEGAKVSASAEDQEVSLTIISDKLKTW